jgi:hypothetical protein
VAYPGGKMGGRMKNILNEIFSAIFCEKAPITFFQSVCPSACLSVRTKQLKNG